MRLLILMPYVLQITTVLIFFSGAFILHSRTKTLPTRIYLICSSVITLTLILNVVLLFLGRQEGLILSQIFTTIAPIAYLLLALAMLFYAKSLPKT